MASTSSSAQLSVHDVFISHRGPDVKNKLASHIYYTLARCGIRAFFDKTEMKVGRLINAQIEGAIISAAVHIAIFSENYAQSAWCLDELTSMMKYPERILPVLYDVKPSDLSRLDKDGPYARALKIHEEKRDGGKPRYDSETIQKWKTALSAVPLRSGYEFKAFNRDEGELVKNIVDEVLKRLLNEAPILDVAEHPVGLNVVAEDFEKTMLGDVVQGVKVVGIVGMGGAGKTTLAKHIFNTHRSNYDRSCFLDDVRSRNSLTELQSKLYEALTGEACKIDSTSEGKAKLRSKRPLSCRALVILDNIDHESQLSALLVVKDVLRSPSLVIITSRDKGLLGQCGVSLLYDMKELSEQHAQELFCMHAFGRGFPKEGFEDLVESFLRKCSGLPLSLKVFGGIVRGNNDTEFWECQLKKISDKLQSDIVKLLKISYDLLDEDDQEIFLDIACFFIGEDGSMAIKIWDGCGLHGLIGLRTLRHKCLVELDEKNRIKMHDHLRDLGRKIANEEPNKPRRLWRPNDVNDLLEKRTVIRGIRGMDYPYLLQFSSRFEVGKGGVSGLKLLELSGMSFWGILGEASRDLVWLRWHDCPCGDLPPWLSVEKLRVLELSAGGVTAFETLWHDKQIPSQLRELVIRGNLVTFPNSIEALQHLDKIVLTNDGFGCKKLKSLPDEFCRLHSLRYLKLMCCYLWSLPERFGDLTNLQHLDLSRCYSLQVLPKSFSRLMRLQHLDLSKCECLMIEHELLANISSLEHVDLSYTGLKELPNEIGEWKNMKVLKLGCDELESLPPSIWNLGGLTTLELSFCRRLNRLPECGVEDKHPTPAKEHSRGGIDHLKRLEKLLVWDCPLGEVTPFTSVLRKDVGLKEPAGLLPYLESLTLSITEISIISITEDVCPSLKHLSLSANSRLVEVEVLLQTLEQLNLSGCRALKRIRGLSLPAKLSQLDISCCGELEELPNLENMTCLKDLNVRGCRKLKAIGGAAHLRCLERVDADDCWELQSIIGLEELQRLEDLRVSAGNVAIWNSIRFLQRLPSHKLSIVTLTTRTVEGVESEVESILNSVSFPLTLLKSSTTTKNSFEENMMLMELPGWVTSCKAVITCFVFRAPSDNGWFQLNFLGPHYDVWTNEGEWISTCIFTRESAAASTIREVATGERPYQLILDAHAFGKMEIKKGWVVIESDGGGEGNTIFQLWNKLITVIHSKGSLCCDWE